MSGTQLILALLVIAAVQIAVALWLRGTLRAELGGGPTRPAGGGESSSGRRAHDYRSYQAVAEEVAKRQVAVLAEMAHELQAYDRACLVHIRRLCELLIAEGRRAQIDAISDVLPSDLDSATRSLSRFAKFTLDADAQQRIRKDMEPNATVLLRYAEQTTSRLEENRFWLGMALEQELREYVTSMGRIFAALEPVPDAMRASDERYRELLRSHPEAARAISRLSAASVVAPSP